MNRRVYAFNSAFDRKLAEPVSKKYKSWTPQFVKAGVSNFMSNLTYPAVIMNDALQGKPMPTLRDMGRFFMNTTVGVAGFLDPATKVGLYPNKEDFGQTLACWGLPPGPYIILPFSNPTTLRDGLARIADPFSNPLTQATEGTMSTGIAGMRLLDNGSGSDSHEGGLDISPYQAFDAYAVQRSLYMQRRNFLVFDGNLPLDPIDARIFREDEFEDELMEASAEWPAPPIRIELGMVDAPIDSSSSGKPTL